jgi:hypothetical protein
VRKSHTDGPIIINLGSVDHARRQNGAKPADYQANSRVDLAAMSVANMPQSGESGDGAAGELRRHKAAFSALETKGSNCRRQR